MFTLLFDTRHRVLLARASGTLDGATFLGLDQAVSRFVARDGRAPLLIDFSAVEDIALSPPDFAARGRQKPLLPDQVRVYVLPTDDLYGLGRLFATYQELSGHRAPLLVRTIDQAYALLALTDPDFQPVLDDD